MKPKATHISFLLTKLALYTCSKHTRTFTPHHLSFAEPLHHVSDQVFQPGHRCQRQGSSRSRCHQQGFQDRRSWNDGKLQSECGCFGTTGFMTRFRMVANAKCVLPPEPLQIFLFDQENFQGRMMEVQNECMNVCERGMDRVRSIIVECGP